VHDGKAPLDKKVGGQHGQDTLLPHLETVAAQERAVEEDSRQHNLHRDFNSPKRVGLGLLGDTALVRVGPGGAKLGAHAACEGAVEAVLLKGVQAVVAGVLVGLDDAVLFELLYNRGAVGKRVVRLEERRGVHQALRHD